MTACYKHSIKFNSFCQTFTDTENSVLPADLMSIKTLKCLIRKTPYPGHPYHVINTFIVSAWTI